METGEERLLLELDRIKKQNAILKKAVLLEQQKSQTLEATIKEKEIQLRSATEENDLLNFNIGRLTKRTQQLQEQLNEKTQSKDSGSGWFSKTSTEVQKKQDELKAAREELAVKISENEELHMKIYELKNEYDQTVQTLQQKLSAIKKTLQKSQDDAAEATKVHEENMAKYTLEKSNLTSRISELEDIVQGLRKTLETKEAQEKQRKAVMNRDLDRLSQTFQSARPTPAANVVAASTSVVDTFDHKAAANLIDGGMNAFRQLVTAFEEYHGVTKEKLEGIVESPSLSLSVSNLLKDLIDMLPKHNSYFEATFANFTMLSRDIKENRRIPFEKKKIFCDSVQDFMKFNTSLLMKQIQHIEIEAQVTPVDEQIISLYNLIQTEVERFCHGTIAFVGTLGYDSGVGYSNLTQYVQQLVATLENLRSHYKNLSSQLQQKFASEYSTAKYANDNIIRSFTSIQLFFGKLINYAKEYLNLIPQPTEIPQIQDTEKTVALNDAEIDSNDPETLEWRQKLTQIERTLSAKLAEAHAKVTQLEVDKQRYQRELTSVKDAFAAKQAQVSTLLTELAEVRKRIDSSENDPLSNLVKETKSKIQLISNTPPTNDLHSLEHENGNGAPLVKTSPSLTIDAGDRNLVATNANFASANPSPSSSQPPTPTFDSKPTTPKYNMVSFDEPSLVSESGLSNIDGKKQKKYSMIVVDDSGRESNSLELSEEERSREAAVKRYFEQKLAQLTSQLTIADEKAMRYYGENQLSHQEVHRLLKDKERLQNEIVRLEGLLKISKDDLDLTRSSLEAQLKVLTEFVMNLKDQSTAYEDEIKQLKKHKVRCIKCKNWNTVDWLLNEGRGGQLCRGGNHYSGYNYG